ncbi:MAG: hypothetical protein EBR82_70655, partial [Caulobacteraceae bacterium]|nr:hypothetical protein [Caulobacteraceae bacterium]
MRYKLLGALVFISCDAVTDTLAYFSIGPRYGAIRGFMPPMVVDTALVTGGTKRNGLTIFSIQKNKYMYWDSVRVQWSDFAGSSGAYIFASDTASMLSPYIRIAGNGLVKSGQTLRVDTSSIATRARVQKAIDSINANVALKVNISDTSSMLTAYLRAAGYGVTKSGQTISADTAAMATRARVQKGIDSLGAVKGPGTVTSVSAGTGMLFTTITSTGSVAADTTVLSTRAWRRKGLDSLAALELSISDTSNMLSPYIRAAGYGLTKSSQSLLVDTAAMATRARIQKAVDSING